MPKKLNDEELKSKKRSVDQKAKQDKKNTKNGSKKISVKTQSETYNKVTTRKETSVSQSTKATKSSKPADSTKKATKATRKAPSKATTKTSSKSTAKTGSKKTATKKNTTKVAKKASTSTEYYDLPTFYNKTVVKLLAQTPSCLFVYWEIAEKDKLELQKQYGEFIFQDTKPYLVIINESMNYSFELEVNDYANSWYINIHDSNCKYTIKLIRKPINQTISIGTPSIDITSSNEMDAPNDHILFDKLGKTVFFKNVQTNIVSKKDISTLSFINNIGKIYNIYDLYKQIYKNEINGNELKAKLSSSQFSSCFK